MHLFNLLMLPFLDRVRDKAGFFVGFGEVVMLFLVVFQRIMNGFGLGGGVRMRHDQTSIQ